MVYGVCIPKNAEQIELAEEWISILLSAEGQSVMQGMGQPSIVPALCPQFENLSPALQTYCASGE
jgi:hypothetical protein